MIAIIDDDLAIREALDDVVQSLGHQSRLFTSAEDLLVDTQRSSFDCMLLDVNMPGMSGLELQSRLNEEGEHPPIIFLTSYRDERTRSAALEGGALAFLGKPVDLPELIKSIDDALES